MSQFFKDLLRDLFRRFGYEVTAYTPMRNHGLRRAQLLREREVDWVLDGGANKGQYASGLRRLGYTGEILSVEPLPAIFRQLEQRAASDPRWSCVHAALASAVGGVDLHVPEITEVSSVLPATGRANTEGWSTERTVRVPATTVDLLLGSAARHPFLKLDLQGYELEALRGAPEALRRAVAVEVELSTVALYEGAALLPEVVAFLDARGYELFSAEPALVDYETGRVLQLDGLFTRRL